MATRKGRPLFGQTLNPYVAGTSGRKPTREFTALNIANFRTLPQVTWLYSRPEESLFSDFVGCIDHSAFFERTFFDGSADMSFSSEYSAAD